MFDFESGINFEFDWNREGEDPEIVKTKLKQWAQVVACSVQQFSPNKIR